MTLTTFLEGEQLALASRPDRLLSAVLGYRAVSRFVIALWTAQSTCSSSTRHLGRAFCCRETRKCLPDVSVVERGSLIGARVFHAQGVELGLDPLQGFFHLIIAVS